MSGNRYVFFTVSVLYLCDREEWEDDQEGTLKVPPRPQYRGSELNYLGRDKIRKDLGISRVTVVL